MTYELLSQSRKHNKQGGFGYGVGFLIIAVAGELEK